MAYDFTPIHLSSVFRSGSALLGRILNAHSKISVTDDKLKFYLFTNENSTLTDAVLIEKLQEIKFRLKNRWGIDLDVDFCLKLVNQNKLTYESLHLALLKLLSKTGDCKVIGEMEVLSWREIEGFLDANPKAKAIMLVRDIRDVVCSFKKNTIAKGNDYLISLFNVLDSMQYFLHYKKNYPDRFLGIKFEDLKYDSIHETKKICKFLGLDFEEGMLDSNNWYDDMGGIWKNTKVSSFYDTKDHINPVGRWKNIISKEDLFLCEWIAKKEMSEFKMEFHSKEISSEVFQNAISKLNSSDLISEAFQNWVMTEKGVQKYPINPKKPENWDQKEIKNLSAFNL